MTDPRPEVSVVIPTRNRETRLAFALDALAEQTLDRDRFEVVVVRAPDGPGPLTDAPAGIAVRFLTAAIAGPAVQRNVGWRASAAPVIAFTDDDCRPAVDWLERLLDSLAGEETILQGRTEPDPDERHLWWGLSRSWEITGETEWYATCNVAYPRAMLESLDGFDERFPAAWGEDTDLGLRARELGAGLRYVDDALVWHAVLPRSLPAAVREARRREATVTVIARHPAYRSELYHRYFAHERHAKLILALGGALVFRRRPLLAAGAALPYLHASIDWRNLTPRGVLRRILHLPARVVVDVAETAITARAAIRNRVALL